MLGASDTDINAVLLGDEISSLGSNHGNEDKVKFSALRTVDREDLVFDLGLCEVLSYYVFLSIVRSNNVDGVLVELHQSVLWILLPQGLAFFKNLQAVVFEADDHIHFLKIVIRSTLLSFIAMWYIDKKEGTVREHELLVWIWLIPTPDSVFVEEEVRHIHQGAMHPILGIQEVKWVTCLD